MAKVLHIIHSLTVGGAARTVLATAKYSAGIGPYHHSLAVLDLKHTDPSAIALALEYGLDIPAVRTREELKSEIERADIVQVNWWQHPDMDSFLRSDLPEMRLLGWFHVAGDRAPQIITRDMAAFFDYVLGGSSYTYLSPSIQTLPSHIREAKTDFVVGGADFARLDGLQRKAHQSFNIGYIGTVNFVKMHPHFVPIHAGLSIPDYKVIVCGGNMHKILESEAQSLGEKDHFDFRGYVADIKPVLEILDVYGYPLCEDTYAASELNLQEAMFAGVPPVVFPYGGIKTLVQHGKTGLIVSSEEEYRDAILYLYENAEERECLGKAAREYALQNFGAKNQAPKMVSVYEKLLLQPKRKHIWPGYSAAGVPGRVISGAEYFIESLGDSGTPYRTSLTSNNLELLWEAEQEITLASELMRSAGILPYAGTYPEDPFLQLWGGLAYFGADKPVEAAGYILRAYEQGLPVHGWRALWYLTLNAADCDDRQLLEITLSKLVEMVPGFEPALALQERLTQGELVLTCKDLRFPRFALR